VQESNHNNLEVDELNPMIAQVIIVVVVVVVVEW
jgi:hypothetical protein